MSAQDWRCHDAAAGNRVAGLCWAGGMPLTAELRNPASPLRGWFEARLPHVDRLTEAWSAHLRAVPTVRPASQQGRLPWGTLGGAIQHRINFALSGAPPLFALLGAGGLTGDPGFRHRAAARFPTHAALSSRRCADLLPVGHDRVIVLPINDEDDIEAPVDADMAAGLEGFFVRLAGFLTRHGLPGARPPPAVEGRLAQVCWALALLEARYRSGDDTWIPGSLEELTPEFLLGLAPHYALSDLPAVISLLYDRGLAALHDLGSVVANPPVLVLGWADGDLVLGDCLIDVKATTHPHRLDPEWLYQLVAYALLDAADLFRIRRVGVYLARQGTLVCWALDQLVALLADRAISWKQLQADFHVLLREVMPDFGGRRWITRPPPPIDPASQRLCTPLRPRPIPSPQHQE